MRSASGRYPHSPASSPASGSSGICAGSGHRAQQRDRVRRREQVQRHELSVVQSLEPPAAGDQHQARAAAGQQRAHLGLVCRVVEHDHGPGAGQALAVERGGLLAVRRDPLRGDAQGPQQPLQGLAGGARGVALGIAVQVEEQLPVGKPPGQPVRGAHGQRGLADPGHPVDRGDHHHAPGGRAGQFGRQPR